METETTISTVGAKRLRFTKAERDAHVAAWKRGGQSAARYGQAHGMRASNLYAWSRRRGPSVTAAAKSSGEQSPAFVPVRLAPDNFSRGTGLRITLRKADLECVIEGAQSAEALASLAGALKREVFNV